MKYIISGEIVDIPTEKKSYDKGSEGKIYKIGKEIYKIYHDHTINEGYGSKEKHHKELLNIPTKQIILPTGLIYTVDGEYAGYKAPFIEGSRKKKSGISQMNSEKLIKNLQILENDFTILSQNYILASDVTHTNYLYSQKENAMYIPEDIKVMVY